MLSKHGEHFAFVGEEGNYTQCMLHYLLDPWQGTHVLHEQIKAMRCTWSPYNLWKALFHHLAHCFTIGSIVRHYLYYILRADLQFTILQQHIYYYLCTNFKKFKEYDMSHVTCALGHKSSFMNDDSWARGNHVWFIIHEQSCKFAMGMLFEKSIIIYLQNCLPYVAINEFGGSLFPSSSGINRP